MEHDVTGITARICTTLEHSGNVSNKLFSCITLGISETVIICGLIRAQDEISRTLSSQLPEFRRRFCKIWRRRRSCLYQVFHCDRYSQRTDYFYYTWAQARTAPCRWTQSKCSYVGAIPMSAAFVFARDHLQGLEGYAMAFRNSNWEPVNHLLIFRPIANSICHTLLKLSSLRHWRTICMVMSAILQLQMRSTVFPEDIGTDYKCCSDLLSTLTVRRWI